MSKYTKKYIKDIASTRVKILYIYIYFNQRSFGRMVGRTLGMFKRPQKRAPKRIMSCMLKILILIGEN
jgi:hypothetical protein